MAGTKTAVLEAAKIEAAIEKYRPKTGADQPASGGTLWHLNTHGLLHEAIVHQCNTDEQKLGREIDVNDAVITKQTAWEIMAAAQRSGVTF